MFIDEKEVCYSCGKAAEIVGIEKCRICFRTFCGDCAYRSGSGRRLCSKNCDAIFTMGDDEEDDHAYDDD